MRFTIAAVIAFIAYTSTQSLAAPTPIVGRTKNALHEKGVLGIHHGSPSQGPPHHEHHRHRHHHHEHHHRHRHHHKHSGVAKTAEKHKLHPFERRGTDVHACPVGSSGKDCHRTGPTDPHHIHHHHKHRHGQHHGGHKPSSHPSPASKKHRVMDPSHSHRHHHKHGKHGHNVKKVNGSSTHSRESILPSHSHRHHRKHRKHGKGSSDHGEHSHSASPPASPAPGNA